LKIKQTKIVCLHFSNPICAFLCKGQRIQRNGTNAKNGMVINMALPEKFKERMKYILKDDYDSFIASFEDRSAVRALRVNTLKTDKDSFIKKAGLDLSPLSFTENGFIFNEEKVGGHPLHLSLTTTFSQLWESSSSGR